MKQRDQQEQRRAEQEAAVKGAPPSVQVTAALIALYAILILFHFVVFAVRMGKWPLIFSGIWQLSIGFWLMGEILKRQKWAWWLVVIGGLAFIFRYLIGLLAWSGRVQQQLPQEPQFIVLYILGLLLLVPIVVRLLKRDSRVAFGLARPVDRTAATGTSDSS